MLSITEIRTLIRAHNKLSKITIPAGAKRADLIKLLSDKGYSVDHKNKNIVKKARTEVITLKGAKKITEPVKKTDEQKAKVVAKKKEKEEKKKEETKAVVKQAKKEAVKEFKEKKKVAQKPKKKATPPVKKAEPVKKATAPVKKAVSKGSHKMPDGSIMKNKDMPKKSKRKVLKETQKPSVSAVVQPGKPADLKIEPKKKEDNITQLKGFKVLEKVYTKYYGERIKLREKYLKGGFKKEMDWEMADDEIDGEMHSEWSTLSMPQDDVKFLFIKSPYNDKSHPLQKVDNMLEERVKNYKTWRELMKQEPKN